MARELGALVDKSLVIMDEVTGEFRLLDTVRSFARTQLAEAGETDDAFQHLYHGYLDEAPGPWHGWLALPPGRDPSFGVDNIRGVLAWCDAQGRPGDAAMLIASDLSPWFMTARAEEARGWFTIAADIEATLPLDEKLARRTALLWLAFTVIDLDSFQTLERSLASVPPDHPARSSLLFIKAWGLVWTDREACRSLVSSVRDSRPGDAAWSRQCDLLVSMSFLLDGRAADAADVITWAATDQPGAVGSHAQLLLAIAFHLDGRHDQTTAVARHLATAPLPGGFAELFAQLVFIIEPMGHDDLPAARRALTELLDKLARDYSHIPSASGLGIQAAAAVATAAGSPADAVTLLTGSRRHGFHRRYEGATALGRAYLRRARLLLSEEQVNAAVSLGNTATQTDLLTLAREVAAERSEPT